jgi:undecaprenyl-diphosphatase
MSHLSSAGSERPSIFHAVVLGTLHGPAELLPISSSGHVVLVPWLMGWTDEESDEELRKSFEVALHAGTALALLLVLRGEVEEAMGRLPLMGLSFAPAALAGYALERPIERRLGTPPTIAGGLIAGSVAMLIADRRAQLRRHEDAGSADALWLGVAQACALVPGVSRNGATLAAARWRQFTRADANRLSRHVALPVIAGATSLKTMRLRERGLAPQYVRPFAAGAIASFLSTLASKWLIRHVERDRSLLPYAVYRTALALLVLVRLGQRSTHRRA